MGSWFRIIRGGVRDLIGPINFLPGKGEENLLEGEGLFERLILVPNVTTIKQL